MESPKKFADRVARKLVVFHKFTPERAALAIQEYWNDVAKSAPRSEDTEKTSGARATIVAAYIASSISNRSVGDAVEIAFGDVRKILRRRGLPRDEVEDLIREHRHLITKLGAKSVSGDQIVNVMGRVEAASLSLGEEVSFSIREETSTSLSTSSLDRGSLSAGSVSSFSKSVSSKR
jgi:hypothetical protein